MSADFGAERYMDMVRYKCERLIQHTPKLDDHNPLQDIIFNIQSNSITTS